MTEAKMCCSQCRTHWSDCDVLADGKCASCLRAENGRLREAVLFFSKHYDGPPDNMLTTWERDLFQVPDEIKSARAAGGE